jgi:hypothetical protein
MLIPGQPTKVRFRARCPKPPRAPKSTCRAHTYLFLNCCTPPPLWFSPLPPPARHPSDGPVRLSPGRLCLAPPASAWLRSSPPVARSPGHAAGPPRTPSALLDATMGHLRPPPGRPSRRRRRWTAPRWPPQHCQPPSHREGVFFFT